MHPSGLKIARGGTVPIEGHVYVRRAADSQFENAVLEMQWTNIYGCRTMGKSSLCVQHFAELRRQHHRVGILDLGVVGGDQRNPGEWLHDLTTGVAIALGFAEGDLLSVLRHHESDTIGQRLERLFLDGVLKHSHGDVFLALDEIDKVTVLDDMGDQILSAFRDLHAHRALGGSLQRLTLCFIGLRPLTQLGESLAPSTSPYAVPIETLDFESSDSTVHSMLSAFERSSRPAADSIYRLLHYTGGQPFLTMDLLSHMKERGCVTVEDLDSLVDKLIRQAEQSPDQYLPQLRKIEGAVLSDGDLAFSALQAYESLLVGKKEPQSDPSTDLLLLAGLVRKRDGRLEPKGELFRRRFDIPWARQMQERALAHMKQFRGRTSAGRESGRICVINTGGTIGMVERGNKVVAPRDEDEFKSYFSSLTAIAGHVELINLFPPRDSINVFPEQWATIARYIYKRRNDGLDGFVVAHGTDTMAYTASAVAFALGPNLRFPVVFTGAQTTPDVPYGDAHVNLYRACEVALKDIPEVVICFGNFVYRAVRAQKKDDRRFEGFESPTYPPLAEITGEITIRRELLRPLPSRKRSIDLRAEFESSVLIVPQFPGLEPSFFDHLLPDEASPCKGVIVQTLGAGNVASQAPYSFIPFVQRAYERGIPVIVTSQYPPDPGSHTKYTPAEAPLKAGAIHAGNMTQSAAVTKFRWVLAQISKRRDWRKLSPEGKRSLVTHMMVEKPIVGEF